MKKLSQMRWTVIVLLSSLAITLVAINCSPEPGTQVSPSPGRDDDGTSTRTATLNCELPSGDKSCGTEDDCVDWCEDELDLSGDARDECLELDEKTVERLVEIFDDVLDSPTESKLDKLKKEDVELICGAVKELDYDVLGDQLDDYSASKARYVLEWIAKTKEVIEIFEAVDKADKEEGRKMMKKLLSRAGRSSSTTDQGVLNGLDEPVASDSDEEKTFIQVALDANNDRVVDYIHNEIITDEDELCDNDNRPEPTGTVKECDVSLTSTEKYNERPDFVEEACVLGVYCKIANENTDNDNEFRKDVARYLNDGSITSFIEEDVDDGGLGLKDDDDAADDWSHAVCARLIKCWADGGLDLGL